MKDYYAILGVPRDASFRTIKRAYRRMARRHHPDLHQGSKEAEERFKEIGEAYEVLGSPRRRALYDRGAWASAREDVVSGKVSSPGRGIVETETLIANFMDLLRRWGGKKHP